MTLRTRTRVGILQEVWLTLARPLRVSLYRFRNEYAVKLVPLTRERRQEASSFILREKTGPLVLLIEEKQIPRGNSLLGLCLLSSLSLYHPVIQCSYDSCRYLFKCLFKLLREDGDRFLETICRCLCIWLHFRPLSVRFFRKIFREYK